MKKSVAVVLLTVVLLQVLGGSALANGPIHVTQLANSNLVVTADVGEVMAIEWMGSDDWEDVCLYGSPFSFEIEWPDRLSDGQPLPFMEIIVGLYNWTDLPWPYSRDRIDKFTGTFYFLTEEEEEEIIEEILEELAVEEKADSPWGSVAFHSDAPALVVYTLQGEKLGEGVPENNVWKTSFAEGQEFVVYEWSEAEGHSLFGAGKVLAGQDGHTDVWNDGSESSVINNILWFPSDSL